jgi:uncharacterized protein (DUF433 family)
VKQREPCQCATRRPIGPRDYACAMDVTVLDRELYTTADAARLLDVPTTTLAWWLDGAVRRGKVYLPVLRKEPRPSSLVTWAEFVEARLLRGYRAAGVPLQNIRPFIERVRATMGVPYPLAHYEPFIDGRQLVYDLQRDVGLDKRLYLVRPGEGDQLQLAPPVEEFLRVVEYDDDLAARIRPFGAASDLVIDPEVQFGQPQIGGVRAEVIAETADAEGEAAAAEAWELPIEDVREAVRWQHRRAG